MSVEKDIQEKVEAALTVALSTACSIMEARESGRGSEVVKMVIHHPLVAPILADREASLHLLDVLLEAYLEAFEPKLLRKARRGDLAAQKRLSDIGAAVCKEAGLFDEYTQH